MISIHPTAVVEDGAKLGEGCVIEPYAFVGEQAILGENVRVKQGARIVGDTHIGDGSTIYSYAIVGDVPQDVFYHGSEGAGVRIGKNATIREFCTINAGTHKFEYCDGLTTIGDNAFIMAYVHIGHDCRVGSDVILANNATLAGHVRLDDFAVVGGLTPIHQFVHVGENCMIAGASALGQDVVPFCLAQGNPAYIRSLNLVGIRRRFDKDTIEEINKAYKILFKSGGGLKDNAEALLKETKSEQVIKMCEFIMNTSRGIPLEKGRE